ncbi:MAG: transglycosylase SLT domain-containing protein [Lachnospiraceae bacterium]|nr:transglycosylase SLT domain-containing protein [Lachnospiraceae bacterium]
MQITIQTRDYIYTSTLTAKAQTAVSGDVPSPSADNLKSIEQFQKVLAKKRAALTSSGSEDTSSSGGVQTASTRNAYTVARSDSDSSTQDSIKVPQELEPLFRKASEKYGVDEKLLVAIAYHESRFKTTATSRSGAMGLMQLMPKTAEGLGVKHPYDPEENIMGGTKLLSSLLKEFGGNLDNALAAYSNGSSTVKKYGGVPPIRQAQEFVSYIHDVYPNGVSLA